jgi:hypothetical protein
MTDRYRSSVQHWRISFANLVTPEFDCPGIDEPASIMVGMVRHLHPCSNPLHPSNLGIPTRQLPMGIRSHNTPNEEKYRYTYQNALFRLIHQSHDDRFVVHGKEHGRLGGRYGYHRHYPSSRFLWNWYSVKGTSLIWIGLMEIGRFPFFPLVDRFPRHGWDRTWKSYPFIRSA